MNRYSLRVPAGRYEPALAQMLELFPAGVEVEEDGDEVVLSGYGAAAPGPEFEQAAVPEGWEDAWRAFHRPVVVGAVWIGAPWHVCDHPGPAVTIDPGRAFGTGAHGSTRAALELLQELPPGPALDVGCGSGVLSIAAGLLGFGPVAAVDLDPLAVEATRANAQRNGVAVEVERADALTDDLPSAPLWLANLELHLLEPLLARPDRPPAVLASGLLDSQTLGGGRRVEVEGWSAELVTR